MTDPNNLEGPPRTREELAENFRELQRVAPKPADRFRLMFGQPPFAMQYQRETWAMLKDTIYAARQAIQDGLENTRELLSVHDRELGRTTKSNRITAERLEREIEAMEAIIEKLNQPDATFDQ